MDLNFKKTKQVTSYAMNARGEVTSKTVTDVYATDWKKVGLFIMSVAGITVAVVLGVYAYITMF